MNKVKMLFILFLIIAFLSGLYFYLNMKEGFNGESKRERGSSGCPNLLVQRGNVLMLYNTDNPLVDGINPIPFFNLDEYINYLEIQKSRGIDCPVLFMQQENNAQGDDVYRMRPSPFDLQGGLPTMTTLYKNEDGAMPEIKVVDANREHPPYNSNNYSGFDPHNQYTGVYTDIDKIHDSTKGKKISDNPMDHNWAGVIYTQQMIDSGKYDDNNITKPVLFTPKTAFYPQIPGNFPPPKDIL